MKIVREICRVLLGATFVFSGFVKGIDLLGSTYKFTDYFNAFGTEWASALSFVLAIILSLTEFGIGAAILLNYRVKLFSWFALVFMGFFLLLTLYIAIQNPVTDCGCFGDALILTNWQTFYKNILFSGFAIVVFLYRKKFINRYNIHFQNGYFVFALLVFGAVSFYSYNHLPIIDFRPYKVGNNIKDGMVIPEGAAGDLFKNTFTYRNKTTGKQESFDESNYPWQDTINWEFVDMQSKLVKKGFTPAIHDFSIENEFGEDVKDYYLNEPGYTFVLVAYNLDKAKRKKLQKINEFAAEAMNNGAHFICLTASNRDIIEKFSAEVNAPYQFYNCDEITLKTMIRSNPGLMLLQDGTVLDMWHWRDVPKFEKLKKKLKLQ
jgi:uncharacterized membrane protein YphA (DoxX/SURF4 family)